VYSYVFGRRSLSRHVRRQERQCQIVARNT
jgi:hypothetical protein